MTTRSVKSAEAMTSTVVLVCLMLVLYLFEPLSVESKVVMIVIDKEPVSSFISKKSEPREEEVKAYKESLSASHDVFLESVLQKGTYTKLYSYTHLMNGIAVHVKSEETPVYPEVAVKYNRDILQVLSLLKNATGVRAIHEDVKFQKLTTHTPSFLGIPGGVWPMLGGTESSGKGVVIGLIDTGINPHHPSFANSSSLGSLNPSKFKGKCATGERFPPSACHGKIVGAQYFARAAIAAGDFIAARDFASPFDADGHGSRTAATAAGNYQIPVIANGFNYGSASGMAPGARIAVYKALYTFGGYMSDVVAAVEKAVEDGVDILSLSIGPSSVPPGPFAFLNVLEMELLFATKAGIFVVQAAGNGGPSSSSVLSFSPSITSVAASFTDRKYNNSIILGNGQTFSGAGLAPPTPGEEPYLIAAAADVSHRNITSIAEVESCQNPQHFIRSMVQQKLIICTYTFDFEYEDADIVTVEDTMQQIGAAGFIITMDPDIGSEQIKGTTMTMRVPAIILNNMQASSALWEYYNANTIRNRSGQAVGFYARARILDGRQAIFTGQAPIVASYSSRGPDVTNALLQTADVLKPNIMAPGSSIWAAWSPNSKGDPYIKGQNFALVSSTSMETPHVAGVAALIKQKHPKWSPAAITSAMMTTADTADHFGSPILAQSAYQLVPATPFDLGAGSINPARAIDPGLVFDAHFSHYVQFLCAVPGVDSDSVRRAVGVGCPRWKKTSWCSDLNTSSVTVSNLVGSRKVIRTVTNVSRKNEVYRVTIREPLGVNVTVWLQVFWIKGNATRHIRINLRALRAMRSHKFGEIVLLGSRNHTVRVPIAVHVGAL